MNEQEIFDTLIEIFKLSTDEQRDYSAITMDTNIYEELGISSISAIYMALEIETRFGFALTNEEAASLKTVKDLVDLIKRKQK